MASRRTSNPVITANDVLCTIVEAHRDIQSLTMVTYLEGPTWRDSNSRLDPRLIGRAMSQDPHPRSFTELRREGLAASLEAMRRELRPGQLLGVISRVRKDDAPTSHIPMMDFMCAVSGTNLQAIREGLSLSGQDQGFILESGRSFHFYGTVLISAEQWRVFLGKCLLMRGLVDERYVGHQLADGHCVLRLSGGEIKTHIPRVVARI